MFKTINKLGLGLDKAALRHTVLSDNLANANTPGFKRSDLVGQNRFTAELSKAADLGLMSTDKRHLTGASFQSQRFSVVRDGSSAMRNDGNNVDPDRERVLLLENQLYYEALIDAVSRKLGQLRSAIVEGRR
ncbi:MAG: flagellar basal body rod protein FlgB [Firmicutes bacterium]|nr:flagellar basal body rod protein FlgB [Bacillota bacterium]